MTLVERGRRDAKASATSIMVRRCLVDGDDSLHTNPELAADAQAAITPCESLAG